MVADSRGGHLGHISDKGGTEDSWEASERNLGRIWEAPGRDLGGSGGQGDHMGPWRSLEEKLTKTILFH